MCRLGSKIRTYAGTTEKQTYTQCPRLHPTESPKNVAFRGYPLATLPLLAPPFVGTAHHRPRRLFRHRAPYLSWFRSMLPLSVEGTWSGCGGELVMRAAVQHPSAMLAHNCVDQRDALERLFRRFVSPLLEQERHASGCALVAEAARPIRVHRAGAWAARRRRSPIRFFAQRDLENVPPFPAGTSTGISTPAQAAARMTGTARRPGTGEAAGYAHPRRLVLTLTPSQTLGSGTATLANQSAARLGLFVST